MGSHPPLPAMAARLAATLLLTGGALGQQQPINVGEVLHNLLFPSHELMGGLERVLDKAQDLDTQHLSCGKRQICEAMSIGNAIERSDGSLEVQRGFLRQVVDTAGDALFELSKPLMEAVGLGRVARQEQSFTSFLVDMVDSFIIEVTRVVAGRRVSRQLETISPVASFLHPAIAIASAIPKAYYGNIIDLAVDVTGVANRRSGAYGLVRSAGLGYFWGGGESSACRTMESNHFADSPFCGGDDGEFFPLGLLNPINSNELGKTVRLGGDGLNPLMDRTRNPSAMKHVGFEWTDLMEPTKMMCKVNNLMEAYQGHIKVVTDPETNMPDYIDAQDIELQGEYQELVNVRRNDEEISLRDLDPEDQQFIQRMQLYEKLKEQMERESSQLPIVRKQTSAEKFDNYCVEVEEQEIRRILAAKNITVVSNTTGSSEDDESSGSGDVEYEATVVVRNDKTSEDLELQLELEDQISDIEKIARIGDMSLLSEKLEAEKGQELEAVESLVRSFNVEANGKIEKVVKIDSKKGIPTLLIQFDSTEYRDAVLKSSRAPEARSGSSARLRRPKVKDLKHVAALVARRH